LRFVNQQRKDPPDVPHSLPVSPSSPRCRRRGANGAAGARRIVQCRLRPGTPPSRPARKSRIGKLSNGLTYYIRQNKPMPARRLELRLVVKAGSILEDDDQRGLAHFVEHMAFNGSTHFKGHEVVSYLQSIGMRSAPT
jgi:zinc protease